jgi:hypothetical protein
MDQTKDRTEGSSKPKSWLGSNTRSVLGSGPAWLESYARLRRLSNEVERQMAICGKDESASPDATVILLEQMGLDYRYDLADFAGKLESVTSYNFNILRPQV